MVYQLPAPSMVTSSTMMCRFTWYVPGGRKTLRCLDFANAIAASIASAARVGAEAHHVDRAGPLTPGRRDELRVQQVDDRRRTVAGDGQPHPVTGAVRVAQQEALLVVEVVGAERGRERGGGAGYAG